MKERGEERRQGKEFHSGSKEKFFTEVKYGMWRPDCRKAERRKEQKV